MTPFELGRYLDYCSELLSLISKTAAIYVQEFPDSVALQAVDEITSLTNGLSRSIWQKIMLLDRRQAEPANDGLSDTWSEISYTNLAVDPNVEAGLHNSQPTAQPNPVVVSATPNPLSKKP